MPEGHVVHAALPLTILYVPATQPVQEPPFGPVNPALQTQAVMTVLVIGEVVSAGHARQVVATVAPTVAEYFPAPQSVQTTLPTALLYLPATQTVHGPPSGPVYPGLQRQWEGKKHVLHTEPEFVAQLLQDVIPS